MSQEDIVRKRLLMSVTELPCPEANNLKPVFAYRVRVRFGDELPCVLLWCFQVNRHARRAGHGDPSSGLQVLAACSTTRVGEDCPNKRRPLQRIQQQI